MLQINNLQVNTDCLTEASLSLFTPPCLWSRSSCSPCINTNPGFTSSSTTRGWTYRRSSRCRPKECTVSPSQRPSSPQSQPTRTNRQKTLRQQNYWSCDLIVLTFPCTYFEKTLSRTHAEMFVYLSFVLFLSTALFFCDLKKKNSENLAIVICQKQ